MRILTTFNQIHRVAGLDGGGDFPDFPYTDPIPREVGQTLLMLYFEMTWPADRDFLNDDGGFVIVFDRPDELQDPRFGLPPLGELEEVQPIECSDGTRWWLGCRWLNNETSVDYVLPEAIAPSDLVDALLDRHEAIVDEAS